jgi:hypothetical protein
MFISFLSWSFGILLYEMLSFGQIPYANIETTEAVIEFVHSGERLAQPEIASDDMYYYCLYFIFFLFSFNIMMECWSELPYYRPTFIELHRNLYSCCQKQFIKLGIETN